MTATASGLLLVLDQVQENGVPLGSTIWSSVDGLTWQQVHSAGSPVNASNFGPLGAIMATTTVLLQSADGGATWSQTPLASTFDGTPITLLAQTPDGHLLAGTLVPADREVAMWLRTPSG